MRILLAEDDPNISTIAKLALEKIGGHTVSIAQDGQEALNMALESQFDVILLDEMMPKLNGLNVCKAYHEQASEASPVIFLSAKSQESDIAAFTQLACGYIAKPFDPMQICKQIEQLLALKGKAKT